MFKDVKCPESIDSPIQEAILEIRYEGNYPADALYGVLFEIFDKFPDRENHALPLLQIPPQLRSVDPSFKYQPYYRAFDNGFAFAIGPHTIVFSALQPYCGWSKWKEFFIPKLEKIEQLKIIRYVERIGFRTLDVFNGNIFDKINTKFIVNDNIITTSPTTFFTEFDQNGVRVLLNIGNAAFVNGQPTKNSLIDIDCINWFNCEADNFFLAFNDSLEKVHKENLQVFFGLLNHNLLTSLNPVY